MVYVWRHSGPHSDPYAMVWRAAPHEYNHITVMQTAAAVIGPVAHYVILFVSNYLLWINMDKLEQILIEEYCNILYDFFSQH